MNRIRVHAAYATSAFLCSSCAKWKESGRVYDLLVAIQVTDAPSVGGVITLCQGCRDDFHRADLELEAPEMEAEARRRESHGIPLVSEAAVNRLQSQEFIDDITERTNEMLRVSRASRQHFTFPKR